MALLSPVGQKRWKRFRRLRRAFWSLAILLGAYAASLGAELVANDRPVFVWHEGRLFLPVFFSTRRTNLSLAV